ALRMCAGALAGLSLLHDAPNYRHSMPTKVVEYMAHGLPVVSTEGPVARSLVTEHPEGPAGIVVPFQDSQAAAEAVLTLRDDRALRLSYAYTGHTIARSSFHWPVQARLFVKQLESWLDEVNGSPGPFPNHDVPKSGSRPLRVNKDTPLFEEITS